MRILCWLTFLLFSTTAFANGDTGGSDTPNTFYCPPISALIKDTKSKTWHTKNGLFKSYSLSFDQSLQKFLGAQWNGATLGQLTCIYKGPLKENFPVLLIFHSLVLEPETKNWHVYAMGIKNCISRKQKACPFIPRTKPKDSGVDQFLQDLERNKPKTSE